MPITSKPMVGLALVLGASLGSAPLWAADDIEQIREQLDALKIQYEQRIKDLEHRLEVAEHKLADRYGDTNSTVAVNAPPPAPRAAAGNNRFNPAIGVILDGEIWSYQQDPADWLIPGFALGGESGLADEGLSIGETELIFSSNVDNWFYAQVTASIAQEDGEFALELEEAYIDTLDLPADLTLRFGRFFSGIGYLNGKHKHTWDFIDQALPYSAMLGSQYGDDGVQLKWLAPTDVYLEFGGELFRGDSFPAAGSANSGFGAHTLFARTGGDVGYSNSWTAGMSWLHAESDGRESSLGDDTLLFDGDTDVYILDLVWKWAPNGNSKQRNLIFQGEYLWRNDDGQAEFQGISGPYDQDNRGWYAQAIYQWQPRWRAGLRIEGLHAGSPGSLFADTTLDADGDDPRRYSLMLDYSNSEFSRLRLQFNSDQTGEHTDNQVALQYIMSIGAHGAHEF